MRRVGALAMLVAMVPAVAHAATTRDRRIVPADPSQPYVALTTGPGERTRARKELAGTEPGRRSRRRSLAYFAQLSDFQLADEESPLRVEVLDQTNGFFGAAWRPQEALMPFVVDASIRDVNANVRSPVRQGDGRRAKLGLTILTGDNADNQQGNEARWVDALLDGDVIDPNSGVVTDESIKGQGCELADRAALAAEAPRYTGVQDYDDYVESGSFYDPDQPVSQFAAFPTYPGLMDRAQQPFKATGLKVPSYVALGNHDGLVQGNQAANSEFVSEATGCLKPIAPALSAGDLTATLTSTLAQTSPQNTVFVPPDPARAPITKPQYRALFAGKQADAHGFKLIDADEAAASHGAASYYSFSPRPGVRFVALDTISTAGVAGPSADGNVDDPQLRWLERTLDRADARDELVVLFSHHAPVSLTASAPDEVAGSCDDDANPSNPGCDLDPRSSSPIHLKDDLVQTVLAHPHVVAWVAGHSHINDVELEKTEDGSSGFWVVRTSAEADWPHQDRLLELMDNRDGTLSLFGTLIDNAGRAEAPPSGTPGADMTPDQLASIARTFGYNDPQAKLDAEGKRSDRNVELLLGDPRRTRDLDVRVRPRRVVAGRRTTLRVRVSRDGERVPGARLRLDGRRTRSDSRGRARLRVTLRKPGRRYFKVHTDLRFALGAFRVVRRR